MKKKILSIEELNFLAQKLISEFKHKIILFEGDLGAGKTTFIKSLIKELGSKDEVSSPTFSIVNEYSIPPDGIVYHFDLYRVESEDEALDFGVEEYLDSGNFCFIEWPEVIINLLDNNYHTIKIISDAGQRTVFFS